MIINSFDKLMLEKPDAGMSLETELEHELVVRTLGPLADSATMTRDSESPGPFPADT